MKCVECRQITPIYGFPGKKPECCKTCIKEGMVNVVHPMCKVCGVRQAGHGIPGGKPECCKGCIKEGMVELRGSKCIVCKTTRPCFGFPSGKALYCGSCKKEGTTDLTHPKCKNEWCNTSVSTHRNKGYCLHCFVHMFPDEKVSRNYKTKETSVTSFIKEHYGQQMDIVSDKKIREGCSKRRPDMLIDLGYQLIIIEIDENQHIEYDTSCENKRTMELSQDVGHRPIIFIRFNPDEYTRGITKVTSCWSLNKMGICTIKKSKQKEWTERLQTLKDAVDYWLLNKTLKTVEIVKLYYSS